MSAASRQIALVGDQSPKGDPYEPDDLVSWRDHNGNPYDARVTEVWGDCVEILPTPHPMGLKGTYFVFSDELTRRLPACPEGTET